MDIARPTALLAGLSPTGFMRRHWQKRPLLVRQALTDFRPLLSRAELFALAARDEVSSRLVSSDAKGGWRLRHGPLPRRALPPVHQAGWTLLVQGLELWLPAAHELLERFRFIPEARLDDVMVSWASDGGGVGPHVDSYDVFLLQITGRRRWRIARQADPSLVPGLPLKILRHFEPEHDWLLEPGDMLYLPPGWGHDGVAEGECMTCSIGFRAWRRAELARHVLQRLIESEPERPARNDALYRDPTQPATATPGRVPPDLQAFAVNAVERLLREPQALAQALGEWLTEPAPQVVFEAGPVRDAAGALRLDRRTRMVYDDDCVFINGESYRMAGRDATAMRVLADTRALPAEGRRKLSAAAGSIVDEWYAAGWLTGMEEEA